MYQTGIVCRANQHIEQSSNFGIVRRGHDLKQRIQCSVDWKRTNDTYLNNKRQGPCIPQVHLDEHKKSARTMIRYCAISVFYMRTTDAGNATRSRAFKIIRIASARQDHVACILIDWVILLHEAQHTEGQ